MKEEVRDLIKKEKALRKAKIAAADKAPKKAAEKKPKKKGK